jgi:hypothetical protein
MSMFNPIPLPDWSLSIALPINRWIHIVCTTALVGGTLFYEFVIPRAIEDLKDETQLAVLGRVRWIFRQIVLSSAVLLIFSGAISSWRLWPTYQGTYKIGLPWWGIHVGFGLIALAIAIRHTIGNRVPRHPLGWMRLNFLIMLIVIFVASVARYVRVNLMEQQMEQNYELSDQAHAR